MSPYSYCLNNPVSLVDPTGHSASCTGGGYSFGLPQYDFWTLQAMKLTPLPQIPQIPAPELRVYADASVSLASYIADLLFYGKVQAIQERNKEYARLQARFAKIMEAMKNPDAVFPRKDVALAQALANEIHLWLREEHPEFAKLEEALGAAGLGVSITAENSSRCDELSDIITSSHLGSLKITIQTDVYATMGEMVTEIATGIVHEVSEAYVAEVKDWGWGDMLDKFTDAHIAAAGYVGSYDNKGFFASQNIGASGFWTTPMLSLRNNPHYYYKEAYRLGLIVNIHYEN